MSIKNFKRSHKRKQLRLIAIEKYGGKCKCCGEWDPVFLTIEHNRGDGADHRRLLKGGSNHVIEDLMRRGWPDKGYSILCWNCNEAMSGGKICPHKKRK